MSETGLDALVEQATVDAYDEYEQRSALHVMLDGHLAVPFQTMVLGVEITVQKIDFLPGSGILDLPLPDPPAAGSEWIEAYRHWAH